MRKISCVITLIMALGSCKKEISKEFPKNYVSLSGTITHQNSDSLFISKSSIVKGIKVLPDGTFLDTLKIETGVYTLFDGKEASSIYLKNGFDLKITLDTKQFDETITYKGIGAVPNNFLAKKSLLIEKSYGLADNQSLETEKFKEFTNTFENEYNTLLNTIKDLDTAFVSGQRKNLTRIKKQLSEIFEEKKILAAMTGQMSPKFVNYENHAGGSTSLTDLKGKFVYIDLWATWCAPCKKEIPFLKAVEKAYHDKNIEFVSISLDRKVDHDAWKTMVIKEQLSGIQLYAQEDRFFGDEFKVSGIPRFILIDPQGKIVDANAPRPSSNALKNLLDGLNI